MLISNKFKSCKNAQKIVSWNFSVLNYTGSVFLFIFLKSKIRCTLLLGRIEMHILREYTLFQIHYTVVNSDLHKLAAPKNSKFKNVLTCKPSPYLAWRIAEVTNVVGVTPVASVPTLLTCLLLLVFPPLLTPLSLVSPAVPTVSCPAVGPAVDVFLALYGSFVPESLL
jgi:hypothetical protein